MIQLSPVCVCEKPSKGATSPVLGVWVFWLPSILVLVEMATMRGNVYIL
jgi:hypothetical protein